MKSNGIPSFFKNIKRRPRQFEFRPRVYDADKEWLENRRKAIEAEVRAEQNRPGNAMDKTSREQFRHRISEGWGIKQTQRTRRTSSRRVIFILIALLVVLYFIYTKLL